ncbi:hypothetical protein C8F01DRAFT_1135351 [Mycena amicta]|nr:hypothetical protein C8F01DRAFT_1135351 [Mycena amicta]
MDAAAMDTDAREPLSSTQAANVQRPFTLRIPKSVLEYRNAGLHFDYDLVTPRDSELRRLKDELAKSQTAEKGLKTRLDLAHDYNEQIVAQLATMTRDARLYREEGEALREQLGKRTRELKEEQARTASAISSVTRLRAQRNTLRADLARASQTGESSAPPVKMEEDADVQIVRSNSPNVPPPASKTVSPVSSTPPSPLEGLVGNSSVPAVASAVRGLPSSPPSVQRVPLSPSLTRQTVDSAEASPTLTPQRTSVVSVEAVLPPLPPPALQPGLKRKRSLESSGESANDAILPQNRAQPSQPRSPIVNVDDGRAFRPPPPVPANVSPPSPPPMPIPERTHYRGLAPPKGHSQVSHYRMPPSSSSVPASSLSVPKPGPSVPRVNVLGIKHLSLLYQTMGEKMTCRSCTRTFPATAAWLELVGHARNEHKTVCEELEALSSAQVVERSHRVQLPPAAANGKKTRP